ncbi:MAG: archaeosine biosynthesis radical SAM protein RaSEA [Candidatus Methanomethylophilaceae archaeon]|nr:archaeosine biosynthesis radical SAM protein RaSEA [Candidatus Methanomethylophilaceae archaeon]
MKDRRTPSEPEALWKEDDMAGGQKVRAMVVILRTNGCCWVRHGGCTMCGYREASLNNVTVKDLESQLEAALSRYSGEPFVKIYTSGSFLDDNEIPAPFRKKVYEAFSGCSRLLFESRPEFITEETVKELPPNVTVALGLESSDPEVLEKSVHKGFAPEDIRRAGTLLKSHNIGVRTYLLLKPPFLTESAAIEDAVSSALFADGFSDEISVNPLNVQHGTMVERLWKKGEFRPPWIWSLFEVFRRLSGKVGARVISSPSGGGSQRGVHNCGECDRSALEAIERFNFSQDISDLNVSCGCIEKWKLCMESGKILGSPADVERDFGNELMLKVI